MYIMFAFALVFGVAATVITAAPSAEASIPNQASFTITGGSYNLTSDGEMMGYFLGTNNGIAIGPLYMEMTYSAVITGGSTYTGVDPSGTFMAQAVVSANPDRIDFYGQYDGPSADVTLIPQSGSMTIGANGACTMVYTDLSAGETWAWNKGGYIGTPELMPDIALDVKGSIQKFILVNLPLYDTSNSSLQTYVNHEGLMEQDFVVDATRDLQGALTALQATFYGRSINEWVIQGGVNLGAQDIEVVSGGNTSNNEPWIKIRSTKPGDIHLFSQLMWVTPGGAGLTWEEIEVKPVEKKWGVIDHTVLDMDPESPETPLLPQASITADAGTEEIPHYQWFSDFVYAWFYWGEQVLPHIDTAGHAWVHWWLIEDDAAGLNEAAILAIMDTLNDKAGQPSTGTQPSGCGPYDPPPALTPQEKIEAVYNGAGIAVNAANFTTFNNTVDGYYYLQNDDTYIKTVSQDDFPGETRGLTMVEVKNTGGEEILVVTLTEYPIDYHGENPVCIEMGKKQYGVPPPPSIVKTPQLRWAGEKIVLEQDLSDYMQGGQTGNFIATFHLEGQSVGELSGSGDTRYKETSQGDIWVYVRSQDTIPEVILETEVQGEADVNLKLYWASPDSAYQEPETWEPYGSPLVNYGFLVYFLAIEDVTLTDVDLGAIADITPEDTLVNLPVGDAVPVAVQVRGWFTSDELAGTTRVAVDVDGDGIYDMPAGRYVMPDDWWALANYNYELRSNWDLMDSAHADDIDSPARTATWGGEEGPYNTGVETTEVPGLAMAPTIGPFNTLQRWSTELIWEASATVPTSDPNYNARNTVVPDGVMNSWDAPMPQALVDFQITGQVNVAAVATHLSTLDKGVLEGYGVNADTGDFESPFYQMEIPSHPSIPANDYAWASWDNNTAIDGPYDMWTDLRVRDIDDQEPAVPNNNDVEVYSDNHGIAGVTVDAILEDGSVTIVATADYPAALKKGKYGPVKSDEITIEWGIVEFDPDFIGTPRNCAEVEPCLVEFTNLTTGATTPYAHSAWDFGDGTPPVLDQAIQTNQKVTHQYAKTGVFDVTLTMEDAEGVVAYQIEFDYITVGEGGGGNSATWSFDGAGCVPKHLPDSFFGSVVLGSLTSIPSEVQGVYYNDAGTWKFWAVAPGSTLDTLVGGLSADYLVCVTGAVDWEIPLP